MAATDASLPTLACSPLGPSQRTLRRRKLRKAFGGKLQQALFMVDLQLKSLRTKCESIEHAVNSCNNDYSNYMGEQNPACSGTGYDFVAHGLHLGAMQEKQWQDASFLNPNAPCFVPDEMLATTTGNHKQELSKDGEDGNMDVEEPLPTPSLELLYEPFPSDNEDARQYRNVDQEHCVMCLEKVADCYCEDILCTSCWKSADDCKCISPQVRQITCDECGWELNHPSLHEATFLAELDTDLQACMECGASNLRAGDFNYVTPSDHRCGKCARRDCQVRIQACDNVDCPSDDLFHQSCMVVKCQSGKTFWLCEVCANSRDVRFEMSEPDGECSSDNASTPGATVIVPAVRMEMSDSEIPTADQKFAGGDSCSKDDVDAGNNAEESSAAGECQRDPSRTIWGEEEILIWMQVTMRMAMSAPATESLHALLQQRWQSAECHIPFDKRGRMKTMIENRFDVSLNE